MQPAITFNPATRTYVVTADDDKGPSIKLSTKDPVQALSKLRAESVTYMLKVNNAKAR